ncbi:MAG: zinc dependent phospholipase C family protein [Myxococcota bacterium]
MPTARARASTAPRGWFAALSAAAAFLCIPAQALAWGLSAHATIARQAIEACPPALRGDLRDHREALVERTLEPDTVLRPRDGRREARHHFLNLEQLDAPPVKHIPSDARAARAKYDRRRLDRAGELPWHAARVYAAVVRALRKGDRGEALRQMGYLAHYVSDAYSPLHATTNYDGQLTGNRGIHKRYETALIARRAKYFRDPGRGGPVPEKKITDVAARVLAILEEGHGLVAPLLAADRKARRAGSPGTGAYLDALFGEVGAS